MRFFYLKAIVILTMILVSCSTKSNKVDKLWVFDQEGDLTKEQIVTFDSLFKDHERKTSNEIALVTTSDYGDDSSLVLYAMNFGKKHGVGKKEKNNGIVIAFSKANHEIRISTGYGMEKILKDDLAKQIVDSIMIPQFKANNYYKGLWNGSLAIVDFLEKPENKIK